MKARRAMADDRPEPAGLSIEVAEGSGVCFGVRRALELAEEALADGGEVYCLGPLIHNPQEIGRLQEQGLRVVEFLDEAETGGVLLVRSHGLEPDVVDEARRRGLRVVDATCPLVRRAQTLAAQMADEGYEVLIAGDAAHPEVRAILGHAPSARVVASAEDLEALEVSGRVALLSQTTFSPGLFRQMAARLAGRPLPEVRVVSTICTATVSRQAAALAVADRVDVMFVVGGRNSANTNRLAELCRSRGVPTYHLEHAGEVQADQLGGRPRVGATAGASTPQWVIQAVCERIKLLQAAAE